jgi:hypothetical protein
MRLVDTVKQAWHDDTTVPIPPAGAAPPSAAGDGGSAVLSLRRSIGALALALPLLITVVDLFLPSVTWHVRGSLSAYYYGGSRELFTGGLAATGALLIAFKALDRRLEFWLTFAAGVLAVFVAFFPTTSCDSCGASTPLQSAIGADIVRDIHYASAFTMIGLLAVTCLLWAILERHTGVGSERYRWLHIASAAVILVAVMLGMLMVLTSPIFDQELLVVEWVSVWAFALSWLFIGPAYKAREAARAAA